MRRAKDFILVLLQNVDPRADIRGVLLGVVRGFHVPQEPDVVGHDKKTGEYIFYDCSAESPKGRRSVCYDREALESRKEHKPEDNAVDMAAAMAIEVLTEEQYREL